jgi:PHD/YefM family antitoxin component YafN of YafNO toxin-antitoxin module
MATWDFDDKQANFLDVLDLATESGPQLIKRGAQRVYVVSSEDWERMRSERAALGRSPLPQGLPRPELLRAGRSPLSSRVDIP